MKLIRTLLDDACCSFSPSLQQCLTDVTVQLNWTTWRHRHFVVHRVRLTCGSRHFQIIENKTGLRTAGLSNAQLFPCGLLRDSHTMNWKELERKRQSRQPASGPRASSTTATLTCSTTQEMELHSWVQSHGG